MLVSTCFQKPRETSSKTGLCVTAVYTQMQEPSFRPAPRSIMQEAQISLQNKSSPAGPLWVLSSLAQNELLLKKKKAELYAFFKPRDVWVKSSFFFLSCFAFLLFPFTSRTSCCDGVTRLYSNISVWCCRIETKRETSLQGEVTGADLSGNKSRRGEVWSFTFHGEALQREQRAASQQLRSRFGKSH